MSENSDGAYPQITDVLSFMVSHPKSDFARKLNGSTGLPVVELPGSRSDDFKYSHFQGIMNLGIFEGKNKLQVLPEKSVFMSFCKVLIFFVTFTLNIQ